MILNAAGAGKPAMAAGGTCGNVLAILSFLGWTTFPVARLNGDAAAEIVRADLIRWGVSLDFAEQSPTTATPIIVQTIRRNRNGNPVHRFSLICPVCGSWFPSFRAVTGKAAQQTLDRLADAGAAGLIPQLFYFDRVSRGALILAKAFAARGAIVMFEPASMGDPRLFQEALSLAHILKYSHERLPSLAKRPATRHTLCLEIETLGSQGLRYRSSLLPSLAWQALAAIRVSDTVDTAGAGDWCTAGLLSQLAVSGVGGLERLRYSDLVAGLRFGQAAAAITCCFEGARGAMYALSRSQLTETAASLLAGGHDLRPNQRGNPARIPLRETLRLYPEEGSEKQSASGAKVTALREMSPVSMLCSSCG